VKFNKKKIPPCYWINKNLYVFVHPDNKMWIKIQSDISNKKADTIPLGWRCFDDIGWNAIGDTDPAKLSDRFVNGWITFCGHKMVVKKVP